MSRSPRRVIVRPTTPEDFDGIIEACRLVYPESAPWNREQLASHLRVFPEGQFVAILPESGRVVGMAASLIVLWSDYEMQLNWRDFTDHGMFTNHDPAGRTLYGAEVLVRPDVQRRGVGTALYQARRELVDRLGLLRIRAGARLRGYHVVADRMTAEDYVVAVVRGELRDPTLTFQLKQGFRVIGVVSEYLRHDPESLGYAAVIEWINRRTARPVDWKGRDRRYQPPPRLRKQPGEGGAAPPAVA
ncbi:MAG: N-acetyltransferase family protein [Hyphomicrobiales bacterium]